MRRSRDQVTSTQKRPRNSVDRKLQNRLRSDRRADAAPTGFVSRIGLQERLGITPDQYRSLVRRSIIQQDGKNNGGYAIFSLETVARLQARKDAGSLFQSVETSSHRHRPISADQYSATDAIRVFELLDAGTSVKDIILITRIHPAIVMLICADYDNIVGSIYLSKTVVDRINAFESLPGSFPVRNATGLLEVFVGCAETRSCRADGCNAQAVRCQNCISRTLRNAVIATRERVLQSIQLQQRTLEPEPATAPIGTPNEEATPPDEPSSLSAASE